MHKKAIWCHQSFQMLRCLNQRFRKTTSQQFRLSDARKICKTYFM